MREIWLAAVSLGIREGRSGWFGFHGVCEWPDKEDELRRSVGRAASMSRNSPQDTRRKGKREWGRQRERGGKEGWEEGRAT